MEVQDRQARVQKQWLNHLSRVEECSSRIATNHWCTWMNKHFLCRLSLQYWNTLTQRYCSPSIGFPQHSTIYCIAIGKITVSIMSIFNLLLGPVLFHLQLKKLKSSFMTVHQYIANVSPTSYPLLSAQHIYNKHLKWRISCSNPVCVLWRGWLEKWAGTGLWCWGSGKS